jgi:DNA-binding transcriptional regulator YiaG
MARNMLRMDARGATMTGSSLRTRRLRLGLSRDRLAHLVGVPADVLTAWEEGCAEISAPSAMEQILRQGEASLRPDEAAMVGRSAGLRSIRHY